ncbi:MAG: SCO family protein [Bacteriovoracales bacterium]|nr:SCO family protein [Bacteriovoracales bacterium]
MTDRLAQKYPKDSRIKRIVLSPLFWGLTCLFFFGVPLTKSMIRKLPPPNPALYELPEYELVNQRGKPFGSLDLKGRFYIVNFFFTSCPTVCPKLMEKMKTIQHRVRGLGDYVALVSFTVDPEVDRPKKLFQEARKYRANPHIWYFLTGEKDEVRELIVGGFKTAMGDSTRVDGGSLYDIAHSQKLVLVDHEGKIRGFYASDKAGINSLMIDLGLLVNREGGPGQRS